MGVQGAWIWIWIWAVPLIAGLVALLSARLSLVLAPRLGLVDRSGGEVQARAQGRRRRRKLHRDVRPIGGWALFLGVWLGAAPALDWSRETVGLLLGSLFILGLGLLDDLRAEGLGPIVKLIGQLLGAAIAVLGGGLTLGRVELYGLELGLELGSGLGGQLLLLLWLVTVTNAFNLLDGLDGLAAGCGAIAAGWLALMAWGAGNREALLLALGLGGAAVGFLRYNFHPARLFLGDEGSYSMGFLLGVLAVEALRLQLQPQPGPGPEFGPEPVSTAIPILVPLLLLGLPLADTAWAVLRRLRARRSIFAPDQEHIHHRLLARLGSQPRAVLLLWGLSLALGAVASSLFLLALASGRLR